MPGRTISPTGSEPGAGAPGLDGPSRTYRFPEDFLWGAATASHQVEGANRRNDWWAFEEAGRVPHASGDACRHYELFEFDFDLAREARHNAHRFSIEWSRVEPSEGTWDAGAVRHYRDVIEALRSRGLEPVITLQHFTLPAWFAQKGGWTHPRSVSRFARYVDHVSRELGDGVRYWLTINEPMVYAKHAYVVGDWPPGRKQAWGRVSLALLNLARAHNAARARLRERHPHALVGFAHSAALIQPCDPSRARDRMAAQLRDLVLNRAFFGLLRGTHPIGGAPFDFIGLNYYTRTVVRGTGSGLIPLAGAECLSDHHADRGPRSDMGWEVYPAGLLQTLRRFSKHGVPLLITENGVATGDEELRSAFLIQHLARVGEALDEGIDVRGYFYWSLVDNFEWTLGTTARFGLFSNDFATQRRTSRPVMGLFRDVCSSHRLVTGGPEEPVDESGPRAPRG